MIITTFFTSWLLAIITIALFNALDKLSNSSCSASVASEPLFDFNGERTEETIRLASPNNTASEIIKKGRYFYVTIENSVTGDKQTLSNTNKEYLIWDANDIAYKFFNKEREMQIGQER